MYTSGAITNGKPKKNGAGLNFLFLSSIITAELITAAPTKVDMDAKSPIRAPPKVFPIFWSPPKATSTKNKAMKKLIRKNSAH